MNRNLMEKSLFEQMGGTYTQVGDYLIPNLTLPEKEQNPVGIWGCGSPVEISDEVRSTDRAGRRDQRHLRYIKQHKRVFYANLLTSCKLNSYLAGVDKQAEDMFSRLVKDLAEKENVTETLKAENQMLWVQRMNSIRNRAREIVNTEIIYA